MKVIKLIVGIAAATGVAVGAAALCKHLKKTAATESASPSNWDGCPDEVDPDFGLDASDIDPTSYVGDSVEETIPVFNEATAPATSSQKSNFDEAPSETV